jgi:hypothetical protein
MIAEPAKARGNSSPATAGPDGSDWAAIGRIVDPSLARRRQRKPDGLASNAQQGTQQEKTSPFRPDRRRRPFARVSHASAFGAHQAVLDEVIGGVAKDDDRRADRPGGVGEQPVSSRAGGDRHASQGLRVAPGKATEADAEPLGAAPGHLAPTGAGGLETMIDMEGDDPATVTVSPGLGQLQRHQ